MCIVTFDFYQGALPNIIKRKVKCGMSLEMSLDDSGFLEVVDLSSSKPGLEADFLNVE
jgi:hypothetical protein